MKLYEATPTGLNSYLSIIERCKIRWENGDWDDETLTWMFNQRSKPMVQQGIGYVDVYGMLLHDATELDKMTGNTDYDDIIDDVEQVLSEGAEVVVFVFNSPGGEVMGSVEAARYIKNLQVPTVAYCQGTMCSAAYKLASACTYVCSTVTGCVGNIGSISVYLDKSRVYDAMGLRYISFVNERAKYKNIGHGDTSLTPEQEQYLQDQINRTGEQFINIVKENRPNVSDDVFTAAWYDGEGSVTVGLSDATVDSIDTVHDIALSLKQLTFV